MSSDLNNVAVINNEDDFRQFLKGRTIRNTIGHAVGAAYPQAPWLVDVNIDGGIATISCPAITKEFGMVLHLTRDLKSMEREAVRKAGELLERFNVSRGNSQFGHITRNKRGDAFHGETGELVKI